MVCTLGWTTVGKQTSFLFVYFFYPVFAGVVVPAVSVPYAVCCTGHMVQPAALVGLNGPQVIPELWANTELTAQQRHTPAMHFSVPS